MNLCSIIPIIVGVISLSLGYLMGKVNNISKDKADHQSDLDALFDY